MVTPEIATVIRMLESLPEQTQSRVVEHLRMWLADLEDESRWDDAFARSQTGLYKAGQETRRQIAEGKAEPMDFDRL